MPLNASLKRSRFLSVTALLCVLCISVIQSVGKAMAASGLPAESEFSPVVVHYQSATCGSISQSRWLSDQQQYETAFQELYQGQISDSPPQPASVNFDRQAMLLISMGQQRTGGYSVKLAAAKMEISNRRARIKVNWTIKQPGMMAIQMLTNPCLLLEVPRGNYEFVDVVDQSGVTRQSIAVDQR